MLALLAPLLAAQVRSIVCNAGELPAGLDFALWPDGFSAWMLEALRKACTGTLFDAGDVFGATDVLLLVYTHTRDEVAEDAI